MPPAGVGRGELDRLVREAIDRSELAVRVKGLEARTFGKASAVFTAAAQSAQVTIPHGLAVAPRFVFATPANPVTGRVEMQESQAADKTNIYLTGFQTAAVAVSITQTFYWMAVA